MRPDVSEPLDHHRCVLKSEPFLPECFKRDVDHSLSRGFFTSQAASDGKGFAGDGARDGKSDLLAVGVHEPRHDLWGGADVRRRNVLVRADQRKDFRGVPSGEPFKLGVGQRMGIDRDAALCPSIGKSRERGLPRHPHGQRGHFSEVDVLMVTKAAL